MLHIFQIIIFDDFFANVIIAFGIVFYSATCVPSLVIMTCQMTAASCPTKVTLKISMVSHAPYSPMHTQEHPYTAKKRSVIMYLSVNWQLVLCLLP